MLSRRAFLTSTASLAVTAGITGTHAAMGPNDKFDLLIKGGDVLDHSQSLRGRRDIGIRYGVIEAVEPDITEARALRVINASGRLVTPVRTISPPSDASLWPRPARGFTPSCISPISG